MQVTTGSWQIASTRLQASEFWQIMLGDKQLQFH